MSLPAFTALADTVPQLDGQCLVCLGRPDNLPPRDKGTTLVIDAVTEGALAAIAALDPARMSQGLVVVTATSEHQARPQAVLRAQKLLAYLFTKYVLLPTTSLRVPDLLGLRPGNAPPEYLHQINLHRNTPLHLRHGLVDKLEAQRVGLPCLLLLPGPSLAPFGPHLPELAKRYLLVTISRALPFLRRHGVAPDVLLQIDTVPMQRHFHHPDDRFPDTLLLTLSMAPIHAVASRFGRVLFIDSFNLSVLPNTARLRESWLSSLLVVLGCAEALHAPRALVAGADLRFHGASKYYNETGREEEAAAVAYDGPMTCPDGRFVHFADADGNAVRTTLQYFATAGEAELFARDMGQSQGMTFANLSRQSILDREVFVPTELTEALEAPEIDRSVFRTKVDAAHTATEKIALRALRALYSRQVEEARREMDLLACLRLGEPDKMDHHVCVRYVRNNLPWFRPSDASRQRQLAANLAEELYKAARFARNVAALHLLGAGGAAVPVLAVAEEEAVIRQELARWRPGWTWRFYGIKALGYEEPMPSSGGIELSALGDWLSFQDVVVVSPGVAKEFDYVLPLLSWENVIVLEELLATRPLVGNGAGAGSESAPCD